MIRRSMVAVTLALAGCGGQGQQDRPAVYAGSLEGTDAILSAVLDGDSMFVYVCGGDATRQTFTRFFSGTLEDGALSASDAGWVLDVSVEGSFTSGTLHDPAGPDYAITIPRTSGSTGVYGRDGGIGCKTAAVMLPGGTIQGTSTCGGAGEFRQVTPQIVPVEVEDGGFPVQVEGVEPFQVLMLTAPLSYP